MVPSLLIAAKHETNAEQIHQTIHGGSVELPSLLITSLSSFEHLLQGRFFKNRCPKEEGCSRLCLVFMPALHVETLQHLYFFSTWQCCISESCDHLVFCSISSLFRHCHVPSYILITDFLLLQCLIHCVTFSHVKVD